MILIALSIFAIPLCVKFLDVPYVNVVPVIVLLCVIGAYAINASIVETWILVVSGLIGFAMKKYGYSKRDRLMVARMVLGTFTGSRSAIRKYADAAELGFVSLIGAAIMVSTSILTAPLGARVAHGIPRRTLEIAFGVFLALVCVRFLFALFG